MKIEYVGPKVIISHTGVSFDNNKEDKYIYLHIVYQLYQALNHDYIEDRIYTYNTVNTNINNQTLLDEAKSICKDIDMKVQLSTQELIKEIDDSIERAQSNAVLDQESKDVLEKNIKLMKSYRVQRRVNKTVYYCLVEALAQLCKKDHIDYIIAPMSHKFLHVFHSVQGVLTRQKFPINSQLDIYEEDGNLLVKLDITEHL